jgi:uncharacterized protein (TIGR01244 family)
MSIRKLDERFHVAPQLAPGQMQDVAALGYKALVCMRPDGEGFGQPTFETVNAAATAQGLAAFYVPARPGALTYVEAQKLKAIIEAADGPVLAYCASGNRCAMAYEMAKQVGITS